MEPTGKTQLQRLLDVLEDQPTDLRPFVRWLTLGRSMAETWFPEFVQEPNLQQLLALKQQIQGQEPELLDAFTSLVAASPHGRHLEAEAQLDALADRNPSTWNHPAQVLLRPRRPCQELLVVCEGRLEQPSGAHSKRRLQSVARKLRKTIQLEAKAKQRRLQIQTHRVKHSRPRGNTLRCVTPP